MQKNNYAAFTGQLTGPLMADHVILGETFYTGIMRVMRLSGTFDSLKVTVPGKLLEAIDHEVIKHRVTMAGEIRSYIRAMPDGTGNHHLTLFVNNIEPALEEFETQNEVSLTGTICKQPTYRFTPFGREISDAMLAVTRGFGKIDYIPIVTWGRNAKWTSKLNVGDYVTVHGRLQSREYEKLLDDGTTLRRTVQELSVQTIASVPAEMKVSV